MAEPSSCILVPLTIPAKPNAKESTVKTQPVDDTQSLPFFATKKLSDALAGQSEIQ
jgi:hypothetical protein